MKNFYVLIISILIFVIANLIIDSFISRFREDNFVGHYDIYSLEESYEIVNIGRSIGADSFNWSIVEEYKGINFGMPGKPLSTDLLLLDFYKNHFNNDTLVIIPITFSFFCTDETLYTPYETIYNYNIPLFGMVQTNATLEYLMRAKGLIESTNYRNQTIPEDFIPESFYEPLVCNSSNLDFFINIILDIKSDYPEVMLILTPHYMEFANKKDNENFIWFYQQIDMLIKITNIEFIDYSELDELQSREYFSDFLHLNTVGRDKFTEIFVKSIQ